MDEQDLAEMEKRWSVGYPKAQEVWDLLREARRLRAWISLVLYPPNAEGELDPKTYDALAAALRGDPAPEVKP